MWSACTGIGSCPMQPGLPAHAGSPRSVAPVHRPEKSGRPPDSFGVGAFRFTAPFGSLGTPGVGCLIHWAEPVTAIDIANRPTRSDRMQPNDIIET